MQAWRSDGRSLRTIAADLNAEGVRTRSGLRSARRNTS
jgi:hypothetical protein